MPAPKLWRIIARTTTVCIIAVALATCIACDSNEPKDDGGGGGGGGSDGIPVRAGSRLGWSQGAASPQQVSAMTFRIYVDGGLMSLSSVSCGQTSSAGGYDCFGGLPSMVPGRHMLELTSILNGIESTRSESLVINFMASITGVAPTSETGSSDGLSTARVLCTTDTGSCYDARALASGLTDVTALTSLPGGRVLFIDGGVRVRIIDGDGLIAEPALLAPRPETSFVGLAVDTSFERTRLVFVAWTEATRGGSHVLNITRYRELAGTLGEGAQIVTGLPFRADSLAPLAVDEAGLLYVATPLASRPTPSSSRLLAGTIRRFTPEGLVPKNSWRGSPVIASGYTYPTSLVIDGDRRRVWLAGRDSAQAPSVSTLSLGSAATFDVGPIATVAHVPAALTSREPSLALSAPAHGAARSLFIVVDGKPARGSADPNEAIDVQPMTLDTPSPVRAITEVSADVWYVVLGHAPEMSILRLTKQAVR